MGTETDTRLVRPARESSPDAGSDEGLTYAQLLETRFGRAG